LTKKVVWTEQAKADIRGIEQPIALQILKTLGRFILTAKAQPNNSKALLRR
jgi:hypothetical protein